MPAIAPYPPLGIRKPEVGRVCLLWHFGEEVPAIVVAVVGPFQVNLAVFGARNDFRAWDVFWSAGDLHNEGTWHWPAWAI